MLGWIIKGSILIILCTVIFGAAGWFAWELFIRPYQPLAEEKETLYQPPPDPSLPEWKNIEALIAEGKVIEARESLYAFLQNFPYSTKLADARTELGKINIALFFDPQRSPDKIEYKVVRGDSLIRIERKLNISRDLLMRFNPSLNPRRLQIGQVVLATKADFTLYIDRKAKRVTLFNGNRFFREYPPIMWDLPEDKNPHPPVQAQVSDKVAWFEGMRVGPGSEEYARSEKWVVISRRPYTFYSASGQRPQGGGIVFSRETMEELSTLLSKNVPVSIQ